MAVRRLSIELDLDSATFTKNVIKATGSVETFTSSLEKTSRQVNKAEDKIPGLTARLRDFVVILSQARTALYNLRVVFVGWIETVVKANIEVERMTYLLSGMSNALSEVGRRREAAENIASLIEMAKTSPFALGALTDSFVKMKSSGIDPLDGSMRSLVDAVSAFGGDDQVLHRASIAIQQMAGKGVISMEELRQQLGEAVPSAVRLMARSMGLTYGELVDLISKGQVEAESSLQAMFYEFERTFGGSSARLVESFAGTISLLRTAMLELSYTVGGFDGDTGAFKGGGFMSELKDAANELVEALNSDEVRRFGYQVGQALAQAITFTRDAIVQIIKFRDIIISLGKAIVYWLGAAMAVAAFRSLGAAVLSTGVAFRTFASHMGVMKAELGATMAMMATAKTTTERLSLAQMGLSAAFTSIRRGLMALAGPIGIAITLLMAIADTMGIFKNKTKEAENAYQDFMAGFVTEDSLNAMDNVINGLRTRVAEMQELMNNTGGSIDSQGVYQVGLSEEQVQATRERLEVVEAELRQQLERRGAMAAQLERNNAQREARARIQEYERTAPEVGAAYNRMAEDLAAERRAISENESLSEEEAAQARAEIRQRELENVQNFVNQRTTLLDEMVAEARRQTEQASGAELAAAQVFETAIIEYAQSQRERYEAMLANFGGVTLVGATVEDDDVDSLNRYSDLIVDLQSELIGLREGQEGAASAAAELRAQLEAGQYGDLTQEQIDNAVRLKEEIENVNQALREQRADERLRERALRDLNRTQTDLITAQGIYNGTLRESDIPLMQIRERFDEIIARVSETNEALREELAIMREQAVEQYSQAQVLDQVYQMRERTAELEIEAIEDVRARREAAFQREVEQIWESIDLERFKGEERKRIEEDVEAYIDALRRRMERENRTRTETMLRDWTDTTEAMDQAAAGWLDDFVNKLVEGELSFGDFAKAIIADIAKIIIRATLANAILSAMGQGGGGGGGFSFGGGNTPQGIVPQAHTGGMVGSLSLQRTKVHPGVFNFAQKYHTGGVVGLGPDEVPIIAKVGERVLTQEQQKYGMGTTVQNSVEVNVINRSGQALNSEEQSTRFDGEKYIIDVVVGAMSRPGKMKETVKATANS